MVSVQVLVLVVGSINMLNSLAKLLYLSRKLNRLGEEVRQNLNPNPTDSPR
jgi:phosphopantothenoylcysteine synthetase/decarboxylase